MASCNYIPLIMFNYVFLLNKQYKFDSISLNECNGKLMGGGSQDSEILW